MITYITFIKYYSPIVEVVALRVVLGESFCKDLVLEFMLDLLLFRLETPFRSALNILRLFRGATRFLLPATPFPVLESFSCCCSSLLFFRKFFVKSLILVKVVPFESLDEEFGELVVAATDLREPCKLLLKKRLHYVS